jgi:penicillin-binding protein A
MSRRIRWFGLGMIVCFCGLLLQLDNIQGLQANAYQHADRNPVTVYNEFANPRGTIVSRDDITLAVSKATPSGLYKYQRVYPTGSLFSQIVGFASYTYGTDTGVEAEYNSYLTYHSQPVKTFSDLLTTQQGTDTIVLTLSDKFQSLARSALGDKDGAVVALNPSNGDVLAMYSNPSFDPNPFASPNSSTEAAEWAKYTSHGGDGVEVGVPIAYQDTFSPGSTFKVITSAATYDHAAKWATYSFPNAPTYQPPGTNLLIHNDSGGPCGGTLEDMLPPSCDTGYANLGVDIGAPALVSEASSFGFGSIPPIDLPTTAGSQSTVCGSQYSESECAVSLEQGQAFLAYSAIGQEDVSATPLEMALVASGIADDGVIMKPHVLDEVLDPKDNVLQTYKPSVWLRATSAKTAAEVSHLMQLVTSQGPPNQGTAYGLFPAAWDVAAKTGTAQALNGTNDWMIAFAPANHPQIALAVVVPNQAKTASGATVSGPIVQKVLAGLFDGQG